MIALGLSLVACVVNPSFHRVYLAALDPYTADSGEGRWTLEDGMLKDVPMPVLSASLYARFYSRDNGEFTGKMLAALRAQFGGHAVQKRADG